MTNHWIDMLNANVVLIMGGNPAEDHPIAMNWLARAKERGTYILHVDPRFNRTSSIADVFAKLRSGTDIAFVGGMINYAIEHNRIQEESVREYTNASWIVGDGYGFAVINYGVSIERISVCEPIAKKFVIGSMTSVR
jgi:formate dehydrogenase major subunit